MPEITNADIIKTWANAPRKSIESHGDEGDFARQALLNPAIFSLLGNDIQGKKILDAGCGQGYLCRLLAKRGAIVTGVEPSENWYRYALEREQAEHLGITYLQEDLSILHDLSNTFDYVISNMVFMDIPDYKAAIRNCIASLKAGGNLIFSITHPCFEEPSTAWLAKGYVEVREYSQEYAIQSTYGCQFHRPLSAYLNLVIQTGCMLQQIIEPQLDQNLVRSGTSDERNLHVPQFLVVHATKSNLQ